MKYKTGFFKRIFQFLFGCRLDIAAEKPTPTPLVDRVKNELQYYWKVQGYNPERYEISEISAVESFIRINVMIVSAAPGYLIGSKGENVALLEQYLTGKLDKRVIITVINAE